MGSNLTRLAAAALLTALPALAASGAVPPTGTRIEVDRTTTADKIQLQMDRHDRWTVPVQLSGSGPFRFLVDTGADRTAVSTEIAASLGLAPGRVVELHSITGASPVQTVALPQLQLSAGRISVSNAPLLHRAHIGADGILGVDSLQSQRVLFDFKAGTMTLTPSAKRSFASDSELVVKAKNRYGRLIVSNAHAEGIDVVVVIDTGSEVTVANEALRARLANRAARRQSGQVELQSVTGGKITGDYSVLKTLEFQGVVMEDLPIVFAEAHTFDRLDLSNRPALLLGMNAIRGFDRISIDFARKQLRVVLPQSGSLNGAVFAAR